MLIVCPTCSSEYTIEIDRIGATGRVVRCAACRAAWFVPPVHTAADEAGTTATLSDPAAGASARSLIGRRGGPGSTMRPSRLPLVATLGLAAALALAIGLRSTVVRTVPESAAAFAAIGLPVNLVGLQLGGINSELSEEASERVLLISGEIMNESSRAIGIPPLALTIEGEHGDLLYNWSDRTDRGELAAHEKRRFQARLSSPPPDGRRVVVSFSTKAGASAVASR